MYVFKLIEEVGRGVAVAVIAAASAAIYDGGVPTTRAAIASLLIGLIPVAYAALRAALANVKLPSKGPVVLPPP